MGDQVKQAIMRPFDTLDQEIAATIERAIQYNFLGLKMRERLPAGDEVDPGGGLPKVRPAPPFRPEPFVTGTQGQIDAVTELLRIAPELKGRIDRVTSLPDHALIEALDASGIPVERYDRTNLAGAWTPSTRTMYLNPRYRGEGERLNHTLGHEAAHALNQLHGSDVLKTMEQLMRMRFNANNVAKAVSGGK